MINDKKNIEHATISKNHFKIFQAKEQLIIIIIFKANIIRHFFILSSPSHYENNLAEIVREPQSLIKD